MRVVDHQVDPGVVSEAVTDGDEWPVLREQILAAEILIVAYGASEGLDTLVVAGTALGGQAGTSRRIENYLGFRTGISVPA